MLVALVVEVGYGVEEEGVVVGYTDEEGVLEEYTDEEGVVVAEVLLDGVVVTGVDVVEASLVWVMV